MFSLWRAGRAAAWWWRLTYRGMPGRRFGSCRTLRAIRRFSCSRSAVSSEVRIRNRAAEAANWYENHKEETAAREGCAAAPSLDHSMPSDPCICNKCTALEVVSACGPERWSLLYFCARQTIMYSVSRLFSFPNPVNEVAARVVAAGVALLAITTLVLTAVFGSPWLWL